jgi:hypothetical protein
MTTGTVLVNGCAVAYGDLENSLESNDLLYSLIEKLTCAQDTVVSLEVSGKRYRAKPADCVAELAKAQLKGEGTHEWKITWDSATSVQHLGSGSSKSRVVKPSARSRGVLATPAYNTYRKALREAQPKVTTRIKECVDRLLAQGGDQVRKRLEAGCLKVEEGALLPKQLIGVKASKALRSVIQVRVLLAQLLHC